MKEPPSAAAASSSPTPASAERPPEEWFARASWGEIPEQAARRPLSLAPLPASAQAFALASLARAAGSRAIVAVAPNVKTQEEFANDLEAWGVNFGFLPQVEPESAAALPDPELAAERLALLNRLIHGQAGVLLVTAASLTQPLPSPKRLQSARLVLEPGSRLAREDLLARLETAGYQREAEVAERGAFSVRGAVLDIFSWDAAYPVRTEWWDEDLESIREFDPVAQISLRSVPSAEISLLCQAGAGDPEPAEATLDDYLSDDAIVVHLAASEADAPEWLEPPPAWEFFAHDFLHAPRGDFILQEKRRDLFLEHLEDWILEDWEIAVFCNNEGEQRRLLEILHEANLELPPPAEGSAGGLRFVLRPLLRGFVWPAGKLVVLSDAEIFGRYQTIRALRRQERLTAMRARRDALDFSAIEEGDYVVHLHQGIALYGGVRTLPASDGRGETEALVLEFAEGAKLYVPVEQAFLVTKYVGVGKKHPPLDTLGGSRWERAKKSARRAVLDYASELLRVQAERESRQSRPFGPDTPWQAEFEDAFLYEETKDQLQAITDAKRDMESAKPMDRLVCGDVGFGKTEVAIRAIFKCVMEGRQAAFLVPTTVLAQQHFQTLSERFADYPIRVDVLSRFRTARQQQDTLKALAKGGVDVVVGTHRLTSKDVVFHNLGLVIVDEEQRFGVKHKELFKQRFNLIDVLTLSATPIPRTLYLALTGARDLSTIETPPPNRVPVETVVGPYDERVIRDAIRRELARNGQVYFLHNRVQSIHAMREKLKLLVPEARIEIGHGQMAEHELEDVMARFVAGESDVLLATTIIESGLDIPNANTILIDRADRFGLADLYQLRGRVGRSEHKAYAYLFLPRHLMAVGDAKKRVNAIRQYTALGSGFKIAMRDLEIRGAGNLLGTAQSGHITAVGFDLYCQLLKTAVATLKGERPPRILETKLDFDFLAFQETGPGRQDKAGAFLPRTYIPESRWRIQAYRRLAETQSPEELRQLSEEWQDRFGPLPAPVRLLLLANEVRIRAAQRRIHAVETQGAKLILKRGDDFVMIGGRFPRLTHPAADSRLSEIIQWIASLA